MRRAKIFCGAAAFAAAALLAGFRAEAECAMSKPLEVPVTMQGRQAVIDAKINGADVRLLVDTGAFFSVIPPDASKRLGVKIKVQNYAKMYGVGGEDFASLGEVHDFTFGKIPLHDLEFLVGGRTFAAGSSGLVGQNILSFTDVEFDMAHGVMRFFKIKDCAGVDMGYWAGGADSFIPIHRLVAGTAHILGSAKLNGQPVRVLFDTGADRSILTLSAAHRIGLSTDGPGVRSAGLQSGFGRSVAESWIVPVSSFAIGSEEIKNTELTVGKFDLEEVDLILGMDFFLSHRIFVVYSQDRMFFSYSGGDVFRLDGPPASVAAGAAPSAELAGAAPEDAESLVRQGEASMARRDFETALKLFDRAVELQPKAAQRYRDRAEARIALGRIDAALEDYSRALELKPNDAPTLLARGSLYFAKKDFSRGDADLGAALKADPEAQLAVAELYDEAGRYADAIPHFDAWIALHAKDDQLWGALNGRCWARAMAGKELDKALDDCNAALWKGPRNSEVLDSRGMVHLRLGRYREAIADYDEALKRQAKLPWSLYGRGLAKKRLGLVAEGAADMQAGVALDPKLPEKARSVGLIDGEARAPSPVAAAKP